MKINYKDKEIELKYSIRAMMMYENITEKNFNPTNTTDMITFLYCILITSAKDYTITFDEFIDEIDSNPDIMVQLTNFITTTFNTQNQIKKK